MKQRMTRGVAIVRKSQGVLLRIKSFRTLGTLLRRTVACSDTFDLCRIYKIGTSDLSISSVVEKRTSEQMVSKKSTGQIGSPISATADTTTIKLCASNQKTMLGTSSWCAAVDLERGDWYIGDRRINMSTAVTRNRKPPTGISSNWTVETLSRWTCALWLTKNVRKRSKALRINMSQHRVRSSVLALGANTNLATS